MFAQERDRIRIGIWVEIATPSHGPLGWGPACRLPGGGVEDLGGGVLPQVRLHDARHTCATLMHLQGVPIALVAAWLGHADISFTMRTYVHAQADALELAARSFAARTSSADR
jgi:integrase